MLAILDYGAGNQTSVRRALEHLGVPCVVTSDPATAEAAQGIIFPGVGAAGQAMQALHASGLEGVLRRVIIRREPLLGICLGCQILLEYSEENDAMTLGIMPGRSVRFPDGMTQEDGSPAPVPHMGWNSLRMVRPSRLLEGVAPDAEFYFVHSYFVEPAPELVIATTTYGREFCSIYGRDGLWAVQCHLEKSGRPGLRVLRNFYDYCRSARPEDVTC
ncbi:imidazole glycerol phosphate synthase subunit HisH [Desulfovibrio sp.]|uniref:imidazole glycerol phosphate synthase subunit HisH n=1 Tax=Desulfovibrio sp. TaxID=885 RepID=UPI0025C6F256|nr:imidazole glycerol phosphate synthase subunit HisH [Desulfovibrio sp.]MCI7568209.1 imidazole glycerol phosphate synthase subunit HisH [Desulfovibrio sp.]